MPSCSVSRPNSATDAATQMLRPLQKGSEPSVQTHTINLPPSLLQRDLQPFITVSVHWERNSSGGLDTESELTLIHGDSKRHCGLPKRKLIPAQGIDGAHALFKASAAGPSTHLCGTRCRPDLTFVKNPLIKLSSKQFEPKPVGTLHTLLEA